jgi:hypothetical protein
MSKSSDHPDNVVWQIRNATGLTQAKFAEKLAVSLPQIKFLELKYQDLTTRTRQRIWRCFGAKITDVRIDNAPKLVARDANGQPYSNDSYKAHVAGTAGLPGQQGQGVNFDDATLVDAVKTYLKLSRKAKCWELASEDLYWALERLVTIRGLARWYRDEINAVAKSKDPVDIKNAHVNCCVAQLTDLRNIIAPVPVEILSAVDYWQQLKARQAFKKKMAKDAKRAPSQD